MRRALLQAVILTLASAAMGLLVNAFSPKGIPLIRPPKLQLRDQDRIPLAEAKELWDSGTAFFLDARTPADYAAGHIALAHNLPVEQFDQYFPKMSAMLSPDSEIIVYCDGDQCDLSHSLMTLLRERGKYVHVRVLFNGWTAWRKAGFPTTKGAEP
ncbi:MAG: rhodanese-like domain-containing protein [Verrucomicrobiia bacterium]|jgi:rhodanese-related sulfurtransferase